MVSPIVLGSVIFVTLFDVGCFSSGSSNNILRLNIKKEPILDPSTACKTYPSLSRQQYTLCRKFPDVTASAIQGVQVAVHECQFQLRAHRWNCSALEKKNKNPHASPMLTKGYKETAFAYAISAAGVTHQVSKACSMGKLQSCGCDMSRLGSRGRHRFTIPRNLRRQYRLSDFPSNPEVLSRHFEWGGCSHNIHFGSQYARKFLDSKDKYKDIHSQINIHNNRAGRLAVIRNVREQCKCHGMSGSCELETCWKAAPDFRKVGDLLRRKYEGASKVQVAVTNKADAKLYKRNGNRPHKMDLLFYEKSPNFCEKNRRLDSPGTTGRLCNKTNSGYDNCDTLCCGRGYNTLKVKRSERCNCKFYWCCYVECDVCTFTEWVTVCK